MLFSSAYAAVMGLLPPLTTEKTAVISDALNHNCIINAIALARPAEKRIYKHLDMSELGRILGETLTQVGIANPLLGVYEPSADDPVAWSMIEPGDGLAAAATLKNRVAARGAACSRCNHPAGPHRRCRWSPCRCSL